MVDWQWHWVGLAAVLVGLLEIGLAAVVYLTRPDLARNRWLALYFLAGGFFNAAFFGLRAFFADPQAAWASGVAASVVFGPFFMFYLFFLSTFETPLARPFRTRTGRLLVVAFFGVYSLVAVVAPKFFLPGVVRFEDLGIWEYGNGPMRRLGLLAATLTVLYGLLVAISAFRRARTVLVRRQMRINMIGFVIHDGATFLWLVHRSMGQPWTNDYGDQLLRVGLLSAAQILLVVVLAYGILKFQLYDIDLKLHFALQGGFVAAAFAAAYVVTKEALEQFIPLEGALLGVAGALVLSLALKQVLRLARGAANCVLPGVRDTTAYRDARKLEVYRAALESATHDRAIMARERDFLRSLRRQLGIPAAVAAGLERDVSSGKPVAARTG